MTTSSYLVATLAVALWVAAWLNWCFRGEVRNFLFAFVFPARWRGSRTPRELLAMSREDFGVFLGMETSAPRFVRGVFSCPKCLSAYLSTVGTMPAVLLFPPGGLLSTLGAFPLIWAAAAWVGYRLYEKF